MEQIVKLAADFIEAQGMMAFVVVVLAVLMYRDQTSRAIESKQQGDMLKILSVQVSNNTAIINKVDEIKTELIAETQSISDASTAPLITSIDASAEIVKQQGDAMNGKLDALESAVNGVVEIMNTTFPSIVTKVEAVSDGMTTVLERLDELKSETDAPTEPIPTIKPDSEEPPLGKIKTKVEMKTAKENI
ncbi:MAG TPA: hypothetical protein ENI05_05155 [Porticoccus sp.]|nr:hypothetical protein [Porticoccus sp.]